MKRLEQVSQPLFLKKASINTFTSHHSEREYNLWLFIYRIYGNESHISAPNSTISCTITSN